MCNMVMPMPLMENKQYPQAREIATQLKSNDPDNPYLDNLVAQIESEAGNFKKAISVMKAATENHPNNMALKTDYADILLKGGQAKASEKILRKLIQKDRGNSFLYRLYAQANGELGNNFESQKALGEFYQLRGNYQKSLDHLHQARSNAGEDYYNQASIDALIKEVQEEKILFEKE